MPKISYFIPAFWEFVEEELKGFELKVVKGSLFNWGVARVEIKVNGKIVAVAYEYFARIYDKSAGPDLISLAHRFEKRFSPENPIEIYCDYRKG